MPTPTDVSLPQVLHQRRHALAELIDFPVILWSGGRYSRNFRANLYPFRASSHFLYFAGIPIENAAIVLNAGQLTLFVDEAPPASTLWHGQMPTREELAAMIGADAAYPLAQLKQHGAGAATVPVQDSTTLTQQSQILGRPIVPDNAPSDLDLTLAKAIISLRLGHDAFALSELCKAAAVTVAAHQAGMAATPYAKTEAQVRSAMEATLFSHNMSSAYNSIVTVHGEILHNEHYHHPIKAGDLLLADVGAETQLGWAGDVTRTWPVSGQFSATQRDIYQIVLAAHDACIETMRPGIEYQEIHLLACQIIAQGLVELGILKGTAESLVEMDAHALFFPHGIGHLIGLDVHDMEDLGDLAGYESGRSRSKRFGLGYLRLNRPLQAGMLVSIEPGFYQVPAILNHPEFRSKYQEVVNWSRLAEFADVRGIRIEDDVLITQAGTEVLTANLSNKVEDIERLVQGT